jgi:hypothetical protein
MDSMCIDEHMLDKTEARGIPDELWPLICEHLTIDEIICLMRVSRPLPPPYVLPL